MNYLSKVDNLTIWAWITFSNSSNALCPSLNNFLAKLFQSQVIILIPFFRVLIILIFSFNLISDKAAAAGNAAAAVGAAALAAVVPATVPDAKFGKNAPAVCAPNPCKGSENHPA